MGVWYEHSKTHPNKGVLLDANERGRAHGLDGVYVGAGQERELEL